MKKSFLDITKRLFRQKKRLILQPFDLNDSTYWIYKIDGYRFSSVRNEIQVIDFQKNSTIAVNTQTIKNTDYVLEFNHYELYVKLLKSNLQYNLSEIDRVEIFGQFESYAD